MRFEEKIEINISGLGFILYSEDHTEQIKEGEDFLTKKFTRGDDVVQSINEGKIIGIATGSPGVFKFEIRKGEPKRDEYIDKDFAFQVTINVKGGKIIIRDLYDLKRWSKQYPTEQAIEIDDGLYSIIVLSDLEDEGTGTLVEEIVLYIVRDDDAFLAKWKSIPSLFI